MKTIIAGSRTVDSTRWRDVAIEHCGWKITEVVSGGARGADQLGEDWARAVGIPVKRFPAEWNLHGKAAGMIRNRQMAEYAEACIILWDCESRGTKNMIEVAQQWGLKLFVLGRANP